MIYAIAYGRIIGTTLKLVLHDRRDRDDPITMDQRSIIQRPGQASIVKHQRPIYRRVASQARKLTRANERALTALDGKLVVPRPRTQQKKAGVRGFVVCAP
jgi:hypothetical protein